MILVDANLLLYANDAGSPHRDLSRRWLQTALAGPELVRFAWLSLWAFLRISTNPRVFEHPLSWIEAEDLVSSWLAQPAAGLLEPGERHWEILAGLARSGQTVGPLVMDAALAAIAIEHGATLCTTTVTSPGSPVFGGSTRCRQRREKSVDCQHTKGEDPAPMPLSIGARLGSYEILDALGTGGMGEVYRARDTKLNRDVAIKILPSEFALDAERLARFKREAQLLASLNHPNIAQIYGFDDATDVHALILELVDGPTLAERIGQAAVRSRKPFRSRVRSVRRSRPHTSKGLFIAT